MNNSFSKMFLCFCLFIFTESKAQDPIAAFQPKVFHTDSDTLLYRILWPEDFDENEEYPLVLFLHGAGERGSDNKRQLTHGSKLFLEHKNDFPAIVIFPQCPKSDYWSNVTIKTKKGKRTFHFDDKGDQPANKSLKMVMHLVDSISDLSYVDNSRIYAAGLSMGGMGTFEIVSRKPDTFAAAVAICGGDNPASAKNYAGKVPFWIFHGEKDDVVPCKNSKRMAKAISKQGGDVKLTLYPEANHNSWDSAFAEPKLLPWLFSKRK
ncbi:carboxylesterase family protein [Fulvivirga sediminis]|nr:prolyl oligopeptidase family serine peptidase [Fulvivirga sediminis]